MLFSVSYLLIVEFIFICCDFGWKLSKLFKFMRREIHKLHFKRSLNFIFIRIFIILLPSVSSFSLPTSSVNLHSWEHKWRCRFHENIVILSNVQVVNLHKKIKNLFSFLPARLISNRYTKAYLYICRRINCFSICLYVCSVRKRKWKTFYHFTCFTPAERLEWSARIANSKFSFDFVEILWWKWNVQQTPLDTQKARDMSVMEHPFQT
jgi:hypothetical protein